jgi:hypothetical protein
MDAVVTVGARTLLDPTRTDDAFLGVCIGLFAELEDGGRIDTDPAAYRADGPRRGVGALWGYITVDASTLPTFDGTLFARDPLEASTRAIETSFSLRAEHLEAFIRGELHGYPGDGVEDDGHVLWANLVVALRRAGVATNAAVLRRVPFRVEFDAGLLDELER